MGILYCWYKPASFGVHLLLRIRQSFTLVLLPEKCSALDALNFGRHESLHLLGRVVVSETSFKGFISIVSTTVGYGLSSIVSNYMSITASSIPPIVSHLSRQPRGKGHSVTPVHANDRLLYYTH